MKSRKLSKLSDMNLAVYEFICNYIIENGQAPMHIEISNELDIDVGSVGGHVERLINHGLLRKKYGKRRGIEVIIPYDDYIKATRLADEVKENVVLNNIINMFYSQQEKGLAKYGELININSYSAIEWIEHAQQEHIDALVYLEALKQKLKTAQ